MIAEMLMCHSLQAVVVGVLRQTAVVEGPREPIHCILPLVLPARSLGQSLGQHQFLPKVMNISIMNQH